MVTYGVLYYCAFVFDKWGEKRSRFKIIGCPTNYDKVIKWGFSKFPLENLFRLRTDNLNVVGPNI